MEMYILRSIAMKEILRKTLPEQTECTLSGKVTETVNRRNPTRARRRSANLPQFETEDMEDKLQICIDFCYRIACSIPQTYQDAITSTKSSQWKNAMGKEMQSIEENKTFTLTQLPTGKQPIGADVYTIKRDIDGSEKYKARFRLIYLFTCTRPDICFVVSKLSQHFAEPTKQHWNTITCSGRAEQGL